MAIHGESKIKVAMRFLTFYNKLSIAWMTPLVAGMSGVITRAEFTLNTPVTKINKY